MVENSHLSHVPLGAFGIAFDDINDERLHQGLVDGCGETLKHHAQLQREKGKLIFLLLVAKLASTK